MDHALSSFNVSGLEKVAFGEALEAAISSVDDFKSKSQKQTGLSTVDTVTLVQASSVLGQSSISDPVQIYACLDISKTDVLKPDGSSVIPPSRQRRVPILVDLAWNVASERLLVSAEQVWDGQDFCG